MELNAILELLEKYDLPTIILGLGFFMYIKTKLKQVDKAVNNRAPQSLTLSQEVSEIHRKVDVNATTQARNIEYIKQEIDSNKISSEKQFSIIGKDIKSLNKRMAIINKTI
jgi:hypothetical protein